MFDLNKNDVNAWSLQNDGYLTVQHYKTVLTLIALGINDLCLLKISFEEVAPHQPLTNTCH